MKTITITILAATMMTIWSGKAWAVCQEDDTACYCAQHPGDCDDAPPPPPDYSEAKRNAAKAAAKAKVATMTTAVPLDVSADCDATSTAGQGTCGVILWLHPTNSDGYHCTVSYEMDGWGNVTVTDVSCGVNNG